MNTQLNNTHRVHNINGVISTDDIIPGKYKHMYTDVNKLAPHVFENIMPGFSKTLMENDALWSNNTFGIGSSREQAATALYAAGIRLIIAPRFGRIFYRNAWNVGIRLIEATPSGNIDHKNRIISVDWQAGELSGPFPTITFSRPPKQLEEIVEHGGLLNWVLLTKIDSKKP